MKKRSVNVPLLLISVGVIIILSSTYIGKFTGYNLEPKIKFYSYEEGLKLAKKENKLALIYIHSENCYICKIFLEDLKKYKDLQNAVLNFIPIKVDFIKERDIAMKYGATGTPEFYIVDGNGSVVVINGQKMVYIGYSTRVDDENARKSFIAFLNYVLANI